MEENWRLYFLVHRAGANKPERERVRGGGRSLGQWGPARAGAKQGKRQALGPWTAEEVAMGYCEAKHRAKHQQAPSSVPVGTNMDEKHSPAGCSPLQLFIARNIRQKVQVVSALYYSRLPLYLVLAVASCQATGSDWAVSISTSPSISMSISIFPYYSHTLPRQPDHQTAANLKYCLYRYPTSVSCTSTRMSARILSCCWPTPTVNDLLSPFAGNSAPKQSHRITSFTRAVSSVTMKHLACHGY